MHKTLARGHENDTNQHLTLTPFYIPSFVVFVKREIRPPFLALLHQIFSPSDNSSPRPSATIKDVSNPAFERLLHSLTNIRVSFLG